MTLAEVLEALPALGSASIKKVLVKHGAREPFYGVKTEDLKRIQRRIKVDYALSIQLYDTGISDAMYLAGLIADPLKMSKADLQRWVEGANWYLLSEYTVPNVASKNPFGLELSLDWIEAPEEMIGSAGWTTLADMIKEGVVLDEALLGKLLMRVEGEIHVSANRVRYCMNRFVISVGLYCFGLSDEALAVATRIGKVKVNMGETACKVPFAPDYINQSKGCAGGAE